MISARRLPRGSMADTAAVHFQYRFCEVTQFTFITAIVICCHCKKVIDYPVPSREATKQIPLDGNKFNYPHPGRVWLVTSRLGMGKLITFFYSVSSDTVSTGSQCNVYLYL